MDSVQKPGNVLYVEFRPMESVHKPGDILYVEFRPMDSVHEPSDILSASRYLFTRKCSDT
jgi:hypothetical protein